LVYQQRVRWYVFSLEPGIEPEGHSIFWLGNTVVNRENRKDNIVLFPAAQEVADMAPDNIGEFEFWCHILLHLPAGMIHYYNVLPYRTSRQDVSDSRFFVYNVPIQRVEFEAKNLNLDLSALGDPANHTHISLRVVSAQDGLLFIISGPNASSDWDVSDTEWSYNENGYHIVLTQTSIYYRADNQPVPFPALPLPISATNPLTVQLEITDDTYGTPYVLVACFQTTYTSALVPRSTSLFSAFSC